MKEEIWTKSTACVEGDCVEVKWHKSTFSAPQGTCVEVGMAGEDGSVFVRDTKNREGAVLEYTRLEWKAFLAGVHAGEFELEV